MKTVPYGGEKTTAVKVHIGVQQAGLQPWPSGHGACQDGGIGASGDKPYLLPIPKYPSTKVYIYPYVNLSYVRKMKRR